MSVVWRKWYGSGFMFLDKTQWFAESDFLANQIGKSKPNCSKRNLCSKLFSKMLKKRPLKISATRWTRGKNRMPFAAVPIRRCQRRYYDDDAFWVWVTERCSPLSARMNLAAQLNFIIFCLFLLQASKFSYLCLFISTRRFEFVRDCFVYLDD